MIRLGGWPDLYLLRPLRWNRIYTTDDKLCDLPSFC